MGSPNCGLACNAAAIFAAALAEVLSKASNVTLTPPTTIVPGLGVPLKVSICDSPRVIPVALAMRLMAAALARALPDALLAGEKGSSSAWEAPISIPLIFRSPALRAGILPATSTEKVNFRLPSDASPLISVKEYTRSLEMISAFEPLFL